MIMPRSKGGMGARKERTPVRQPASNDDAEPLDPALLFGPSSLCESVTSLFV